LRYRCCPCDYDLCTLCLNKHKTGTEKYGESGTTPGEGDFFFNNFDLSDDEDEDENDLGQLNESDIEDENDED
jgi:hypothetical protein